MPIRRPRPQWKAPCFEPLPRASGGLYFHPSIVPTSSSVLAPTSRGGSSLVQIPVELIRRPLFLALIVIPIVCPLGPVAHISVTPQAASLRQRKKLTCT